MKVMKTLATASTALFMAGFAMTAAPAASAVTTEAFGTQFVTGPPPNVMGYTVSNLQLSHDVIPAGVAGRLFEATLTAKSIQGSPRPVVPAYHARAANGDDYESLWTVDAPNAIAAGPLAPGTETTGKLYFDVVGADPDSVVYRSPTEDLYIWKN